VLSPYGTGLLFFFIKLHVHKQSLEAFKVLVNITINKRLVAFGIGLNVKKKVFI